MRGGGPPFSAGSAGRAERLPALMQARGPSPRTKRSEHICSLTSGPLGRDWQSSGRGGGQWKADMGRTDPSSEFGYWPTAILSKIDQIQHPIELDLGQNEKGGIAHLMCAI